MTSCDLVGFGMRAHFVDKERAVNSENSGPDWGKSQSMAFDSCRLAWLKFLDIQMTVEPRECLPEDRLALRDLLR